MNTLASSQSRQFPLRDKELQRKNSPNCTWFSLLSLGTITPIFAWEAVDAWRTTGQIFWIFSQFYVSVSAQDAVTTIRRRKGSDVNSNMVLTLV